MNAYYKKIKKNDVNKKYNRKNDFELCKDNINFCGWERYISWIGER